MIRNRGGRDRKMVLQYPERYFILFMRRPVQIKYAAKAAHGPRGVQGETVPACPSYIGARFRQVINRIVRRPGKEEKCVNTN